MQISLDQISLEDERFRISYFFSLERMALSLRKIGLIHPPLVTFRDNRCVIVSGWKRVLACRQASLQSIPVLVVEEKDDVEAFLLAFYENLAFREYNLLEKTEILSRLKKFGQSEKDILNTYLSVLDIPRTFYHLDIFLAFSQFEPGLKKIILEKGMPFTSLEILASFTPAERKIIIPLIVPLGQNKQKEVLENLREISVREDLSVREILNSKEILKVLDSETRPPVQKADKIRLILNRKRYPHLSSQEKSFDSSLKRLRWPQDIAVHHSPFFEDENITVQFRFKDEKEFQGHLIKLQQVASRKEFSRLFKFQGNG